MKFIDNIKAGAIRMLLGSKISLGPANSFFGMSNIGNSLRRTSAEQDPAGAYAGWVYAAISKRAKRIGAIQLELYQVKKNDMVEEIFDHELLALMGKANPLQTQYQFFYTIEMLLGIWGSAPIYKDRAGTNKVRHLWVLRPDLLKPVVAKDGTIERYEYRISGRTERFATEDVININEPSPLSLTTGYSPVNAAALEIDADMSAALWNKHLIENFAEPGGVLQTEHKLSDEEFKRLKDDWNARQAGPTNAGRWALLERGLKVEAIGRGPKDMDLNESRRFHRNAITAILGVPMALMTSEDVNLANAEAAERVFAVDTVDPQMRLITGAFNEFLVKEFGVDLWIDYESPIPNDTLKDIQLAANGEGRWMTVNEARDIFNLPEIEGGDTIFKPLGVMPQVGPGTQGNQSTDGEKSAPLPTGYERIEAKHSKTSRKNARIIRGVKARGFYRRKAIEGTVEKVMDSIRKLAKEPGVKSTGKVILKLKGARMVDEKIDNLPGEENHDPRLVAERKSFLRNLRNENSKRKKQLGGYFKTQRNEVLEKLKEEGIPKGRGGRIAAKSTADRWISRILFDKTNADKGLLTIGEALYKDNLKLGSEAIATLLGVAATDIMTTPFVVNFIEDRSFELLKVNQSTVEELRETLREGVALGEDIGEIRGRIETVYDAAEGFRAETIARTETAAAQNYGRHEEMRMQGVSRQKWMTIGGSQRHGEMPGLDGQVRDIDEDFEVDGEMLAYPGDPGGSPSNTINCQCSISPTLDDVN